ncbi:Acetylpolyamine amidohydrolase 2 [Alphaproteobacteria bacterium SO-S41]|nr:Acetylpolyamine amidohydrolase 2 [Alphaproteobacteria bacterium SO-S41]
MKTVYSPLHLSHAHAHEFEGGQLIAAKDVPARAELVLDAIRGRGIGPVLAPQHFGNVPILRVHTAEFIHVLEQAWARWVGKHGYDNREAFPSAWPARGMAPKHIEDIEAALGYYAFDTATPIVAGTWTAARHAADCALTAAEFVLHGERAAFALCRPPGHHAAGDTYGGYCFLNNAAIAAQHLTDRGRRVAILDVDMHHGNGTQAIFYGRDDVLTVSLHGDPATYYPHFSGFTDETGEGAGEGFNLNLPLPANTLWPAYAQAIEVAAERIRAFAPDTLVVPLGVDTVVDDPAGGFRLEGADYTRLGVALAKLKLPTLFTMEGGYRLDTLGPAVADVLTGFEGA